MIPRAILCLVLLVSVAHALVHMYELSLPSVEQEIAQGYFPNDPASGKAVNGWMAFAWRSPLGIGALVAGWLVDRFGARRMMAIYLAGCGVMCVLAGVWLPLWGLMMVMGCMGTFACIYHPAGLALISHETTVKNRARALGIHGIFGSAGIGSSPFLAGLVLSVCYNLNIPDGWRVCYRLLAVPGLLLAMVFVYLHMTQRHRETSEPQTRTDGNHEEDGAAWASYFTLTAIAALMGFVYSGVLAFLPRYMDGAGITIDGVPREGMRNYLTGGVLLVGCIAQYVSGRIARHRLLEPQMAAIFLCSAPCLVWMAHASGSLCVAATAVFALVHFMHQPIYNSLIAKYTPRRHRSLCYGFSFAMGMGIGSLGAVFVGNIEQNAVIYQTMAAVALTGGILTLILWRWNRPA